ncbi:salicylate hydroxylase, partial [Crepidotus variabilis]
GAGIVGLTLVVALQRMDVDNKLDIVVYEGSDVLGEIGAGINIWSRGWHIFKSIGLEENLIKILHEPPDGKERLVLRYRKSDQRDGLFLEDLICTDGIYRFHRGELQTTLLAQVKGDVMRFSHRLTDYEEGGKEVKLLFENGQTSTCDVLIGSDGIKSVVRRCFLEKQKVPRSLGPEIVWSGEYAYRGLVPKAKLQEMYPGHPACTTPTMQIITYTVSHLDLVNVVAAICDYSKEGTVFEGQASGLQCTQAELLDAFKGWEPEVESLLKCIDQPTKWAVQVVNPLDQYASGRVVLVGDAAHAMLPHKGAGAGTGMEDAYILASLLTSPSCNKAEIHKVADIYDLVRCGSGNSIARESREVGRLAQLSSPGMEQYTENDRSIPLSRLEDTMRRIRDRMEWLWLTTAEPERIRALNLLERGSKRSRAVL